MKRILSLAIVLAMASSSSVMAEATVDTVAGGLTNPCGVAIQPGTGTIFVADSGAGRVVRIVDGKAEAVITDFPVDSYGKGPKYAIGPLGLLFIDENVLVVGGGGYPDNEDLLRVYNLPKAGEAAIKADQMAASFKLEKTEDLAGEGNFYGLAYDGSSIFVTTNGDDTKGWIGRAAVTGTKVGPFQRAIATKEATEVDAPVGIAMAPDGSIVVGQMGEITVPGDALITFYDSKNGQVLANYETGLSDITGVAYAGKKNLYVTDFNWGKTADGGLFRVIASKNKNKPVKVERIATLDKPTALVTDADGNVYVTIIGSGEGASGSLVKVTP
tara:strand:- start:2787 stop:3773 length:987 start_codon:yes stop_codon:yes gene_type:complete